MSRKEDLLFCKIAISNGLITNEAAQKALALCDKRELDGGRRPLIGAIFTKYNLMQNQDVKRIYSAVQKRLGTTVGPELAPARGKKGAKGAGARGDRRAKPARPVDPKTLWMGIGGLVTFVLIIGIMIVLLSTGGEKAPEAATEGGGDAVVPSATGPGGSARGPGSGGSAAATPAVSTAKELTDDLKLQIQEAIGAARDHVDVRAGLASLEKMEKGLRDKGYEPPASLLGAIKEWQQRVKDEGGGDSSAPAPAPEAAPPAPEPAPAPAPAPEAKPAADEGDSSTDEDLEKELGLEG